MTNRFNSDRIRARQDGFSVKGRSSPGNRHSALASRRYVMLGLILLGLLLVSVAYADVPTSISTSLDSISDGETSAFLFGDCSEEFFESYVVLSPRPGESERYSLTDTGQAAQESASGRIFLECLPSTPEPTIEIIATGSNEVNGPESTTVTATLFLCDFPNNGGESCLPRASATITINGDTEPPIAPLALNISAVSGNEQATGVGQGVEDLVAKITDQNNEPVPNARVTWSIVDGDGSLSPTEGRSGSDGLVRTRLTPGKARQITVKAELESNGASAIFSITILLDLTTIPGLNRSQISVANACMNAIGVSDSSLNSLQQDFQNRCKDLVYAPIGDAREGIINITPDFSGIVRNFNILFGNIQIDNTMQRIHQLREGLRRDGTSGLKVSFGDQTVSGAAISSLLEETGATGGGASADEAGFEKLGFFVNGEIRFGDKDETGRVAGFDFSTQGITAGVDYRFMEGLVLGGAIGYANANADIDSSAGELDASGWSLTTYGTYYATDQFYLEGSLTYGWDSYDQDRKINYRLLGAPRTANADFDGRRYAIFFGGGYDFLSGPGIFDVYGRVRYIKADVDDYKEDGAQGLDLMIDSQEAASFKSILGFQYSHAISTAKAVLLPQAWFEWAHEFEAADDDVGGFFVNDPTRTAFSLATDSFDTDSFRLGLGLGAQFAEGRSAFLSYEAALGVSNYAEHKFSAGLRISY